MTDKALLKSFLALKSMTMQELSDKTGISLSSLNYKLNEAREFRQSEIKAIQDVLELSNEERDNIFGHVKYCVETNHYLFNGHRSISNIK